MFKFFKPTIIYVRIFVNSIEIRDVNKEITIKRTALNKFSTERLLIGNFNNAHDFIRELLKEIGGDRIIRPSINAVVQPMEKKVGGLSQVELRPFYDIMEHNGAKRVEIYENDDLLSDEAVKAYFI